MPHKWVTGCAFIGGICASVFAQNSRGGVLYSTIAGAAAAGSTQPSYSASLNLNESVNNAGPVGFGDDYTSASPGLTGAQINSGTYPNATPDGSLISTDSYVQLASFSYYGDLEPGPNGSETTLRNGTQLYSEGADIRVEFFDSAGRVDQEADFNGPTATSPSGTGMLTATSVQGPGFHTITLYSPVYVPASGYFVIEPYLPSSENITVGAPTPVGTVGASFTGYFGAAPTVGSGVANTFATITSNPNDENSSTLYTNSTFANISSQSPDSADDVFSYTPSPSNAVSSGYLQVELDGNSLVPEPGTISVLAVGLVGLFSRRSRAARV